MKFEHPQTLRVRDSVLVVVDIQERLFGGMDTDLRAGILHSLPILGAATDALGIPVLVNEQYPQGLGASVPPLKTACPGAFEPGYEADTAAPSLERVGGGDAGPRLFAKLCFSAMEHAPFADALAATGLPPVSKHSA